MAEGGLLAFAGAALEVGRAVLRPCRTCFSKHEFTRPQFLAILCLMRYEEWTFREAGVRLAEAGELRHALLRGLSFNLYRLKHGYLSMRMSTKPNSF